MKAIRKIDLMHKVFGKLEGEKCKGCTNLIKRECGRRYYKCTVYGQSYSTSTDWRLSYPACSMKNKDWDGNEIVRIVHTTAARVCEDMPLEGQYVMEGL